MAGGTPNGHSVSGSSRSASLLVNTTTLNNMVQDAVGVGRKESSFPFDPLNVDFDHGRVEVLLHHKSMGKNWIPICG